MVLVWAQDEGMCVSVRYVGLKGCFFSCCTKIKIERGGESFFFASQAALVFDFAISPHPLVFNYGDGEEPGGEGSAGSISYANIMLAPFLIFTVFTRKCKQLLT